MQVLRQTTGVSARQPAQSQVRPCTVLRAVSQEVRQAVTTTDAVEDIYIGFPKNDYAPRSGRVGRVIRDDPKKYPGKDDLGPLLGVSGGWAGGEAALQKLRDSIKEEMAAQKTSAPKPKAASSPKSGKDAIYVGFGKDELELRKSGVPGRVIYDDAAKYPGKEDVGFLAGATGGFAAGERGVKAYVATGEVKLRKAGEPGGQPISPLTSAFLLLFASTGGGVFLSQYYDASTGSFKPEIVNAINLDGISVNMLLGFLPLAAAAGSVVVGRYVLSTLSASMRETVASSAETAKTVAIYGAFFGAVFLAARAVLEV